MNNEKYNQIIDEVYNSYLKHTIIGVNTGLDLDRVKGYLNNCLVEYDGYYEHFTNTSFQYGYRPHTKEEFINKCKTDSEFSKKWGLKIEERELSYEEKRKKYKISDRIYPDDKWMEKNNIPTKLITITYKNEKIEIYE